MTHNVGLAQGVPEHEKVDNLRRLTSRCIHYPDSQVNMVRMESCTTGR